jgi:cardiolipin synthase
MLYVEPDAGTAPLVQFIEHADKQLLLNCYFIDDPEVLAAIGADVTRGVSVYVQIAGNPYGMQPGQLQSEQDALAKTGAQVKIAPPAFEGQDGHYSFDHAKYAVSDRGALIGTPNWSVSGFSRDRDYIYTSSDPALMKALSTVFISDFNGMQAPDVSSIDPNLVLSPGSENQLVAIIGQPGPIHIEMEELSKEPEIIRALEAKGAQVEIILPKNGAKKALIDSLESYGVQVRLLSGLYLHAKVIEGAQFDFLGSENFSMTSLLDNREVGIVLNDPGYMQTLSDTFQTDWSNAQ